MSLAVALEFLLLAAIWGSSYLAMQIATPELGAFAMGFSRAALAAVVLVPIALVRRQAGALRGRMLSVMLVGVLNSGVPSVLNGWSLLHISTGLSSILNAAMPLFGALIAWSWLHERLTVWRVGGVVVGFAGVAWLSWDRLQGGVAAVVGFAILAGLASAFSHGASASVARRYLGGVPPLAVAAGSQLGAAISLCLPAAWSWPVSAPSHVAWMAVLLSGVGSSAIGFILFFRLVERLGPSIPLTVTFMTPVFAVLYGVVLAHEQLTISIALAGAMILLGVALANGLLPRRSSTRKYLAEAP